jgi:23S rRNA (cytidine1920-2'-O)/16S rRNA (cytidine1409-2'-O)-methyltransferase
MVTQKIRLDKLLIDRGIAPTLEKARALILARAVKVNEVYLDKAGAPVGVDAEIHLKGEENPYVSRGGLKLKEALKKFELDVEGIVALDVGASTGGFTDIRYYDGADLDEQIDLATIDASFISLKIVLPAVLKLLGDKAQIMALIKPQFEVPKEEVGKGGVVQDPAIHDRVVQDISEFCQTLNLEVKGTCASPILGPAGNREFFILARKKEQNGN